MCLETFHKERYKALQETSNKGIEVDQVEGILDLDKINGWLSSNHHKVAEFYNRLVKVETSELLRGVKKEAEIITKFHNRYLDIERQADDKINKLNAPKVEAQELIAK